MKLRVARKVCAESAWVEVKLMPYSCSRHRGGTILTAIQRMREAGEPVFRFEAVRGVDVAEDQAAALHYMVMKTVKLGKQITQKYYEERIR